jgi:hypothetical protein
MKSIFISLTILLCVINECYKEYPVVYEDFQMENDTATSSLFQFYEY